MTQNDLLPLFMCYVPTADSKNVASVNLLFTKGTVPQNDEEAIATMQLTAQSLDSSFGTQTVYAEPTVTDFDGHKAYILELQSYLGEEVVSNQAIVIIEVEGGNLTLTYTYHTEEELEAVIESVTSVSFSK